MRLPLLVVAAALLAALATSGCSSEPDEVAEAPTAAEADLSALERRRARSDGAVLEQQAADARSATSRKVYASTEDEPGLIEMELSGEMPMGDPEDPSSAGTSSPTDLDRASEEVGPWVDMNLVGRAFRSEHRSLKGCYDDAANRTSGLGRRVDVRLTVGTDGRARGVKLAASSPVQNSGLARCLAGVLEKARFPEARNGDKSFTYPLTF